MKFALICPSRGRPDRFTTMLQSAFETADAPADIRTYAVLDADDERLSEYMDLDAAIVQIIVQGRREMLSTAFRVGADRALVDGADILMMCGDDVVFRTRAWDGKVVDAFARYADGLALIYPNDGNGNAGLDGVVRGNHWFVTRRWIDTVGCFCPDGFEHFCTDTVPELIAQRAGRLVALPEVLIEHMHFKHLKSKKDDTYAYGRRRDSEGKSVSDRDIERMKAMEPWIAERAAMVREAMQ